MTIRRCMWAQDGGAGEEVEARVLYVRQPNAVEEFGIALRNLPFEIAQWWHGGHTRSAWLHRWEDGNCGDPGARPLFYADDTETINSYEDYKLWRTLGRVSDALLLLVALAIIILILAFAGVPI